MVFVKFVALVYCLTDIFLSMYGVRVMPDTKHATPYNERKFRMPDTPQPKFSFMKTNPK